MDRDNFVIRLILKARDEGFARAATNVNRAMDGMRRSVGDAQRSMRQLDNQTDRTTRGMDKLNRSTRDTARGINAIRGPTDRLAASIRNLGRDTERTESRLARMERRVNTHRESIAKFDNELRGMRILIIASQIQALVTAAISLGDQLVAVAGSAIAAGTALAGMGAAAASQAVPAFGLLAATIFRVKQVTDALQQAQLMQKQEATRTTSETNKQTDAMDKLTGAHESLTDAQRAVSEGHRNVAKAIAEQRRELQDLTMANRSAQLQDQEAQERLRTLRSQGVTGFELQGAELDAQRARVERRRAGQDLRGAQTGRGPFAPEGVKNALNQLQAAEQALARARRGMDNARRDANEGALGTVGAARNLQFLRAQLSDAENALFDSVTRLRDTWKQVARPITDIIVESFTRATDRAEEVIRGPKLIRAFTRLARETSDQVDRLTRFGSSDRSVSFFERSTARLRENLQPATTAAIRLARAFMNIADAAAPALHRLIEDFARFTGRIERFTENDNRMREIFEFGERHLHAWLRLAGAIGQLLTAIIAPGGNAAFGAAESGLRTINFFTQEIRKATEWINGHPILVAEHFRDSEQVLRRIFDLFVEIGKIAFELFDPDSVDTFADAIELLLPSFAQAADLFGRLSRFIIGILSIPGIKEVFQGGFGFVILFRLLGRFRGLLTGVRGDFISMARGAERVTSAIAGATTTTGGLTARIRAGKAAWDSYALSAERAAVATGEVTAAGGVGAANARFAQLGSEAERQRLLQQSAAAGAGGGLLARGRGALGRGIGRLGGAARLVGGGALLIGGLSALTTQGSVGERLQQGVSDASFGLFPGLRSTDDRTNKILEGIRKFKGLVRMDDITNSWDDFNDEQKRTIRQAQELHNAGVRVREAFNRMFPRGGIVNREEFNQALDRIKAFRDGTVDNLKQVRDNMRITSTFLGESAKKGSDAWRVAMVQNTQAGVENIIEAANQGKIKWKDAMEAIADITQRQMKLVRGHVRSLSADARDALSNNFRTARIRAERQLGSLEDATGESLRTIRRLVATELASYGFTASQVRGIIRAKRHPDSLFSRGSRGVEDGSLPGGGTPAVGGFGGSFVGQAGERGGDFIQTLLGKGEAVLNWGQQNLVEPALNAMYGFGLQGLFKRSRGWHAGGWGSRGYARGGGTDLPTQVPLGGVNSTLLRIASAILRRFPGLIITSSTGGGHASNSLHYTGNALDIGGPFGLMNRAAAFARSRFGGSLAEGIHNPNLSIKGGHPVPPSFWGSAVWGDHADHIHLGYLGGAIRGLARLLRGGQFNINQVGVTGGGAMGAVANAALDSVRRGAIRRAREAIANQMGGSAAEGAAGAPAPPGQLRNWLRTALRITGQLTPGNLNALYGRAMQESGGNPRAQNNWDSNARAGTPSKGLLQTIDSTFSSYAIRGHKNIWNPIDNAIAAIRYMIANYGHIVGPSSSGYAKGGELPGPLGAARMILAHGKEWILNERQKGRLSALTGMGIGQLKTALGFGGGRGQFKEGGEVDRSFDLPDLLPQTPGGTIGLIRRLVKFITKFGNVNDNLDILTREGGLFDQFTANLEDFSNKLAANVTRGLFRIKNGRVAHRRGRDEVWMSQQTLDNLEETGTLLRRIDNQIGNGLARVRAAIRRIRRGGVDDDERDDLIGLRVQRRNLRGRLTTVRGLRGENLQSRFEQQQAVQDAIQQRLTDRIERSDTRFGRRLGGLDIMDRILAATGNISLGSRSAVLNARNNVLGEQIAALTGFRDRAASRGLTDTVDELNDRIADLNVTMQENTRALFDARVEEVNRQQQLVSSATSARSRIAELQGQLGLISGTDAQAAMVAQARIALQALVTQGSGLSQLLGEAQAAGDQQRIDELQQAILDNTVAQLEGTVQIRELEGTLNQTQSFTSTAWQWFRTAIFNGSGGLLPGFTPPVGALGAGLPIPSGTWGAGGGGSGIAAMQKIVGVENMEITQNETVDFVALSNKIAWDINVPTT